MVYTCAENGWIILLMMIHKSGKWHIAGCMLDFPEKRTWGYWNCNAVIFKDNTRNDAALGSLSSLAITTNWIYITERVGFEPTNSFLLNDFESFAFDHSATFPNLLTLTINLLNVN